MSAPRLLRLGLYLGALSALALIAAPIALAAEEGAATAHEHGPGEVLAFLGIAILFAIGIGCLLAVLRIILPGPARKADAALARLSTGRLLLTGLLPVVGIGLLGAAAHATHVKALEIVWAVGLFLPTALLAFIGALAAVPHLGAGLLRGSREHSLLARAVVGSLALCFALGASAALQPLVHFVAMVVVGWFLGAGLGVIFKPTTPETGDT